jgi:hypothetical protein
MINPLCRVRAGFLKAFDVAKSVRRELPHELPLRQNSTDALDGFLVLND